MSYGAVPGEVSKIIFLYSDGLYPNVLLKWMVEKYHATVIALAVDLGKQQDFERLESEALQFGASKLLVVDAREEFSEEYISKCIKANGIYEDKYPLSAALSRPLLAKLAVDLAHAEGADAVAHGNRGNDQVRLDTYLTTLDPGLKVLAVLRDWGAGENLITSYAAENGMLAPTSEYSHSENLWGKSTECGRLEDVSQEPPVDATSYVKRVEDTPDLPEYVTLDFERGLPVALNGERLRLKDLILNLNVRAAEHGVGKTDMVEDGLVGLKTRAIYEWPGAMCVLEAHKELERLVCTLDENTFKPILDAKWAYLAYAGLWHEPLIDDLNAYADKVNEKVCGWVKLKLFKGRVDIVARNSPNALYDHRTAIYNFGHSFGLDSASAFVRVHSLRSKTAYWIGKHSQKKK